MGYRIGLDVGIASVGWTVLQTESTDGSSAPVKILDLGVRMFDVAEKNGSSLALPRREARSARRRLRRHRHRIARVKSLLECHGIMSTQDIEKMYKRNGSTPDVYELRVAGLDRLLDREELTRVLIHLAQRRGFRSNRKSDEDSDESGQLLAAVARNQQLLREGQYRTVGEMMLRDPSFSTKRNKESNYTKTVSRDMVIHEANAILDRQVDLRSSLVDYTMKQDYVQILSAQRNFDDGPGGNSPYGGNLFERMVGLCTFESSSGEKRAPKNSYSFEKFQLLTKVQGLRIYKLSSDGTRVNYALTEAEKKMIITRAYQQIKLTFASLRKLLKLDDSATFVGLTYSPRAGKKNPESATFVTLKFYHDIKKRLVDYPEVLQALSNDQMDQIGWVLSIWKSDEKRRERLRELDLSNPTVDALLPINASGFGHLSLKALKKLIPHLESGLDYDKACSSVGYNFRSLADGTRTLSLPKFPDEEVSNPIVRRGISQTIRVINAIVRKYGSPEAVHIELAREMSKTSKDRDIATNRRDNNQRVNEKNKAEIRELTGSQNVRGLDIVKYKLYKQQQGWCLYSGTVIELPRLFETGYVEVDHIIPYGVSFDDSYYNKILVKTAENRQKGNRTPLEYLRTRSDKRAKYIALVNSLSLSSIKKNNLLRDVTTAELELDDFKARNLNDTRYITRVLAQFIDQRLQFAPSSSRIKRVVAVNGAVTSYMRKRWGLSKHRDAGDLHHAQDAVVVACISDGLIQRVTKHDKFKRTLLSDKTRFTVSQDGVSGTSCYVDKETGETFTWDSFDEKHLLRDDSYVPWPQFRDELLARLGSNPKESIRSLDLPTYTNLDELRPIFVSRMPCRKVSGPAHKETIHGPRVIESDNKSLPSKTSTVTKVALTELKLRNGHIQGYYNPQDDRILYDALRSRLMQFDGDAKKAFTEPFYKVSADGQTRTLVRKVKIEARVTVGVRVHQGRGIAGNASMVRIDVFEKDGKHYFVPIYIADTVNLWLPTRAATAHKFQDQWREMDASYNFKFSLHQNDVVLIKPRRHLDIMYSDGRKQPIEECLLYFRGADSASANISLRTHDGSGSAKGVGLQSLEVFDKYVVDYLGRVSRVKHETRKSFKVKRGGNSKCQADMSS